MTSHSERPQAELSLLPKPAKLVSRYINHADSVQFVSWLQDQELPIHASIFPVAIQKGFYSLTRTDLRWLCKAILQAGNAPSVGQMRTAILSRDVADLR